VAKNHVHGEIISLQRQGSRVDPVYNL